MKAEKSIVNVIRCLRSCVGLTCSFVVFGQ